MTTHLTEDRIRALALALSEDPERAGCSDIDNWLEAERRLAAGLAEAAEDWTAETTPVAADADDLPPKAGTPERP